MKTDRTKQLQNAAHATDYNYSRVVLGSEYGDAAVENHTITERYSKAAFTLRPLSGRDETPYHNLKLQRAQTYVPPVSDGAGMSLVSSPIPLQKRNNLGTRMSSARYETPPINSILRPQTQLGLRPPP